VGKAAEYYLIFERQEWKIIEKTRVNLGDAKKTEHLEGSR